MESERLGDWEWLDRPAQTISELSKICLEQPSHQRKRYGEFNSSSMFKGNRKNCSASAEYVNHLFRGVQGYSGIKVANCEGILEVITTASMKDNQYIVIRLYIDTLRACLNVYDIRERDVSCGRTWPHRSTYMSTFLQNSTVLQSLHASSKPGTWMECNDDVYGSLVNDDSPPSVSV